MEIILKNSKSCENVSVNWFIDEVLCIIKKKSNKNTLKNTVVETVVGHRTSTAKFLPLI